MNLMEILNRKPFIIAEVGSNWLNLTDCLNSISLAKKCGADAVKFQLFTDSDLYGFSNRKAEKNYFPDSLPDFPFQLPARWLPKMKEKADVVGIELMVTAFSPEGVEVIDKFVNIHKIASSDLSYPQLLNKVKETGKPAILSTGGSDPTEIKHALSFLGPETILLYCNPSYPSYAHDLFNMEALKVLNHPVGLSDHSLDVLYAPVSAVRHFGAAVIEKHVNFVDTLGHSPDRAHSLNATDFKRMVDMVRERKDGWIASPEEHDMVTKHRRRLIAIRPILKGERFKYGENFGTFRSMNYDIRGLTGFAWDKAHGKIAVKDIPQGDSIGFDSIEGF